MNLTLPRAVLANISFVTPTLAVGGDLAYDLDLAVRQVDELVDLGVTTIVDVRVEASDESFVDDLAPHIDYVHLGVDDRHGLVLPDEWFDVGVDAIQAADGVVVAHCHMGINRGPSMGLAALLADGWDIGDALGAIRTARPIAAIGYAEQALDWHLRRTGATGPGRVAARRALADWRRANNIDVSSIIRRVRALESRGAAVTPDLYDSIAGRNRSGE